MCCNNFRNGCNGCFDQRMMARNNRCGCDCDFDNGFAAFGGEAFADVPMRRTMVNDLNRRGCGCGCNCNCC